MQTGLIESMVNSLTAKESSDSQSILLVEGAMGVLDGGGRQGRGCVADLAE